MKLKVLISILIISSLLALNSCKKAVDSPSNLIVVSIYPYELLLKQMVGPEIEVRTLIPPNFSPHTYNPSPAELKSLYDADLVFSNGYGLEINIQTALNALGEKHLSAEQLLQLPQKEENPNPHIWLSPRLMKKLVSELEEPLQRTFPSYKDSISFHCRELISQFSSLDSLIIQERAQFSHTPIITYHDSFHYFIQDYKLDYLGSIQSSPGQEPTPKELVYLGDLIKANQVKAIFVEPQMDRKSANVLAKEFHLQVIELDPLGRTINAQSLPKLILINWNRMKQAW
ncbi:MAG TPA: metal ABC transporter substrate-binding protein [Candidatus Syntrophosphaera thermopropionivorans]|jgi:zinc transport system substrate-binding protein|nr:metal ABC transporter substrate-binding protein [Candidatus Syntrophosphaera thermopropionivorans]